MVGILVTLSFFFFAVGTAASTSQELKYCVPDFWHKQDAFEVAKLKPTFVFLFDPPFVLPNDDIRRQPTVPFPCRDVRMQGVYSDVLLQMGRSVPELNDAMCVYAGTRCSFDGVVKFVEHTARINTGHKFIAGTYLLNIPRRRNVHTIQSAPLIVDSMMLLYRDDLKPAPWKDALRRISKPFGGGAWLVAALTAVLFLILVIAFLICFAPRDRSLIDQVKWFLKRPFERVREKIAWFQIVAGFTVYLAVLVLLYEVAVAVQVFRERPPLVSDIEQLVSLNHSKIATIKGAASEAILQLYLNPEGKQNGRSVTWNNKGKSLSEMLTMLRNGTVDYIFTFRSSVKYQLHVRNMCISVTAIPVQMNVVGGWFYSSLIDPVFRSKVDKALNAMTINRAPWKAIRRYGPCIVSVGGEEEVGFRVVLLLLLIAIAPFVFFFLIVILIAKMQPAAVVGNFLLPRMVGIYIQIIELYEYIARTIRSGLLNSVLHAPAESTLNSTPQGQDTSTGPDNI